MALAPDSVIIPVLTRRELAAMMAMQGMLSSNAIYGGIADEERKMTNAEICAFRSIAFADALLKELDGGN